MMSAFLEKNKTHQLCGKQLPRLRDELNEAIAA